MSGGLRVDAIGGLCPVQADGTVDGVPFYFRSRGDRWQMAIGEKPVDVTLGWADGWLREAEYGTWPDAGYMPIEEAEEIIIRCAAEYMKETQTNDA